MGYKFTFDTIAITGATGTIGISLIKRNYLEPPKPSTISPLPSKAALSALYAFIPCFRAVLR